MTDGKIMVILRAEKKQHWLRLGSSSCIKAGPAVGKLYWLSEGCPGCVDCPVPVVASVALPQSVKTDKTMLRLHLLCGATLAAWWLAILSS